MNKILFICLMLALGAVQSYGEIMGGIHNRFNFGKIKPIAEYRFDECEFENNKAKDNLGKYDAEVSSSLTTINSAIVNRVAKFLSADSDMIVKNLPLGGNYGDKTTISLWLEWNDDGSKMTPLEFKNGYKLTIDSNNISIKSASAEVYTSSEQLKNKNNKLTKWDMEYNWHHIVAIFTNGDINSCKLYIDSQEQELNRSNITNRSKSVVSGVLKIGGRSYSGFMDELKIYDDELSKDVIENIYNNESEHLNYDGSLREETMCLSDKYACANPKPFTLAFEDNIRGDFKIVGNSNLCHDEDRDGSCDDPGTLNNNSAYMINIDIDNSDETFNHSSAKLDIPENSEILWAKLYWQGSFYGATKDEKEQFADILFKTPKRGYSSVDINNPSYDFNWVILPDNRFYYQASADVTQMVKDGLNGWYSVANIHSYTAKNAEDNGIINGVIPGGGYGGWSLVIAYKNDSLDLRNVTISDGYIGIYSEKEASLLKDFAKIHDCDINKVGVFNELNISLGGFLTPKKGAVNSKIGFFVGEGDLSGGGDILKVTDKEGNSYPLSNNKNPANNNFNSTISDFGKELNSSYLDPHFSSNTLGIDIDTFDLKGIMKNDQNSTVVTLTTDWDGYHPSVFAFSTQIYEPKVCYLEDIYNTDGTKYNSEPVRAGTEFNIKTIIKNEGIDRAVDIKTVIELGNILEYSNDSIKIDNNEKSDRVGDDEAEANDKNITARLGKDSSANTGGYLDLNDSTVLSYKARVLYDDNKTENIYKISYKSDTLGIYFDNVPLRKCRAGVFTPPIAYKPIKGNYNINESDKLFSDKYIRTKVVNKDINLSLNAFNEDRTALKKFKAKVTVSLIDTELSSVVKNFGEIELNGNNSRVAISKFKIDNAYKNLSAKVYYCQDDYGNIDTDWKSCYKIENNITTCKNVAGFRCKVADSLDNFAIRPEKFSFGSGMSALSYVKAGEDINISISALDDNNNSTKNYNEYKDVSFKLDLNQTDISKCDFNSSDLTIDNLTIFTNGELNGTISYNDVGELKIDISEKIGQEFAIIDKNDTDDDDRLIQSSHKQIRFIPYNFDVNSTFINNSTHDESYAFYSNNDLANSPKWIIGAKAVNKHGDTTKNYNKECVANNLTLTTNIEVNSSATSIEPLTLKIAEDNNSSFRDLQDVISDIAITKDFIIGKDSFSDGASKKSIILNFARNQMIPQKSSKVTFKSVDANDSEVSGSDNPNRSFTYKYMRAYIQDPIEVIGVEELNATVFYEAYDPDGLGKNSISGERGWKRVDYDDTSGKMKFFDMKARYGSNRVILTNNNNQTLHIKAKNVPESNKVTMDLDDDFKYITNTISTNVFFSPDSANWAGEGKVGMMVDTNISRRTKFKRMNW